MHGSALNCCASMAHCYWLFAQQAAAKEAQAAALKLRLAGNSMADSMVDDMLDRRAARSKARAAKARAAKARAGGDGDDIAADDDGDDGEIEWSQSSNNNALQRAFASGNSSVATDKAAAVQVANINANFAAGDTGESYGVAVAKDAEAEDDVMVVDDEADGGHRGGHGIRIDLEDADAPMDIGIDDTDEDDDLMRPRKRRRASSRARPAKTGRDATGANLIVESQVDDMNRADVRRNKLPAAQGDEPTKGGKGGKRRKSRTPTKRASASVKGSPEPFGTGESPMVTMARYVA